MHKSACAICNDARRTARRPGAKDFVFAGGGDGRMMDKLVTALGVGEVVGPGKHGSVVRVGADRFQVLVLLLRLAATGAGVHGNLFQLAALHAPALSDDRAATAAGKKMLFAAHVFAVTGCPPYFPVLPCEARAPMAARLNLPAIKR